MSEKTLDKPEGHEMRVARSERADDNTQWTVQDALYDASKAIREADGEVTGVLVLYQERLPNGDFKPHYRAAGVSMQEQLYFLESAKHIVMKEVFGE